MEGIILPLLINFTGYTIPDVINNFSIRFLFFSVQIISILVIIFIVRHFRISISNFVDFFSFKELDLLIDDDDLKREKRVSKTFYIVLLFILFQTLFINIYILTGDLIAHFNIHPFFASALFVNLIIIILNFIVLYLLKHMFETMKIERNHIIKRIKEKNSLRLDWEKRAL
ncbi:MAG: hypothetical protein ACOCRO_10865 [Halanaerobiales bacterium]